MSEFIENTYYINDRIPEEMKTRLLNLENKIISLREEGKITAQQFRSLHGMIIPKKLKKEKYKSNSDHAPIRRWYFEVGWDGWEEYWDLRDELRGVEKFVKKYK